MNSKLNNLVNKNDAVSPVIGVILMVAITVILAAVIGSYAFGMDTPEQAPQSSIRGVADTENDTKVIKLVHQGGESIVFEDTATTVNIGGTDAGFNLTSDDNKRFETGDTLYIVNTSGGYNVTNYVNSSVSHLNSTDGTSTSANVKIIDGVSQQLIANMNMRLSN